MELFKCQAVLLLLAVAVCAILADSQPDNGMIQEVCKIIGFSDLPKLLWMKYMKKYPLK